MSDPDRKSNYETPQYQEVCDNSLPEGWYRFVEASGTKYQQRVCQHTDGEQTSQAGFMTAHPTG